MAYEAFAGVYDALNEDANYDALFCHVRGVLNAHGIQDGIVADLGCGTGELTLRLAGCGYDMIGVDASAEMLMQAMNRTLELSPRPLFLHQRMEQLDLYGTVGACLCCLDSVNYVTDPHALQEAFRRVALFLEPGGLFLFDANTEEKFARINGEVYLREADDVYCVWQAALEGRRCTYSFDLFARQENGLWSREEETHEERVYPQDELIAMLEKAGFIDIECRFEPLLAPVDGQRDRLFYSARKKS